MDQLVDLMDAGELDIELSEGFGPRQFIEVKEPVAVADSDEDAIVQAVQVLSSLVTSSLRFRSYALRLLRFALRWTSCSRMSQLVRTRSLASKKASRFLKLLPRLIYQTKSQAEQARAVLDQALKSPQT